MFFTNLCIGYLIWGGRFTAGIAIFLMYLNWIQPAEDTFSNPALFITSLIGTAVMIVGHKMAKSVDNDASKED